MTDDGQVRVFGMNHPDMDRIPVPNGASCFHCDELITWEDVGYSSTYIYPDANGKPAARRIVQHRACFLRGIIGSVAHIEGRCSCFKKDSCESDDPGLSKRQAAEAALRAWENRQKLLK